MKIAFMTSGTIKSSISHRALSIAKQLVKKGHTVSIFSPKFDKYSKFKDEKITEIDGVKIIRPLQMRSVSFEIGLIPYMLSSVFLLFKLNPDIIHIYKPNPLTIVGLLLKLIKGTPVILDLDDLDVEVMKIEKNPRLKIMLVEISKMLSEKYANAITVASGCLKNYYKNRYKKKHIHYISNGGDFADMPKINLKKISKNRIVFIGNMNRINILEPLIHAVRDIKILKIDIHVTIIGDGKYLSYFRILSKKFGVLNNITFLGHIPQADLGKFIKPGDLGYCYMPNETTTRACSNMKVFQYMQFGVVPLVSNVGDLPEYIFNGKAGYLVNHSNTNLLINTIKKSFSNKKQKMEKIEFVSMHADKYYKWSVLADKIEKIYKKTL